MVQEHQKSIPAGRPAKKLMRTAGFVIMELAIVLGIVLVLAGVFFVWRVSDRPLNVGFAKHRVEAALRNPENGMYARADNLFLHWPALDGPLLLALTGVNVMDQADQVVVSVDEAALGLSGVQLLRGKIMPLALILKKPSLYVKRTAQEIAIGYSPQDLRDKQPHSDAGQTGLTMRIVDYIANPEGESDASPLAALRQFKIEDARVLVDDDVLALQWVVPDFDVTLKGHKTGLNAEFDMTLTPESPKGTSRIQGQVDFDRRRARFDLTVNLHDFDTGIIAEKLPALEAAQNHDVVLSGVINGVLNQDMTPQALQAQLSSGRGALSVPAAYDAPLPYQDFEAAVQYDAAQGTLTMDRFQATLKGVTVQGRGQASQIQSAEGDETLIAGTVNLQVDHAHHDEIAALWPRGLEDEAATEWVLEKLSDGSFSDLRFETGFQARKPAAEAPSWDVSVSGLTGRLLYRDMNIAYLKRLSPLENAAGAVTFDYDQELLTVTADSGTLNGLDIAAGTVRLENVLKAATGTADLDLRVQGPVRRVFSFLEQERIGVRHGFDLNRVEGQVDAQINLYFPTLLDVKMEDVKMSVDGRTADVVLPDVLRGLDMTGGAYAVTLKENALDINGTAVLNNRPADIRYQTFIDQARRPYKTRVTASLTGDNALLRRLGVQLDEFWSGDFPVRVVHTEFADKETAEIEADLGNGFLFFDPFDYKKDRRQPARAVMTATLRKGEIQSVSGLNIQAPDARIQNARLVFEGGALRHMHIPQFNMGQTSGRTDLDMNAAGAMTVNLTGPFLDARPFLDSKKKKGKAQDTPLALSVQMDQVRTHEDEIVRQVKIFADIDGLGRFNQLEMDAAAGRGQIYLRYKPDGTGQRVFRFEADDAGATLKAFGVYDKIRGGTMQISGAPLASIYDRNISGTAMMSDFKVVKAPALARLLGALSLPGLLQALDGQGVQFSRLESGFDWQYRPAGSLLTLKDGRTSGNAMGLTFDGTFDHAESRVDVAGTVIPLSDLNTMIGNIPLVGDILTGGSGSLFAATYTVQGSGDEPQVSVNPLSVLTPGILRRILFEKN